MATKPLRDAGFVVKRELARRSPTAKAAKSWRLRSKRNRNAVTIVSFDLGVIMTNRNANHPLWAPLGSERYEHGRRVKTNDKHPERTGFVGKAFDATVNQAVEIFADEQTELVMKKYGL
jgi:hypothetical protein